VQICKGGSDDAGTYDADEAIVRRALKRLDELEGALLAQPVAEVGEGLSDEELWKLYDDKLGQIGFAEDWPWIFNYVRAALAKWGHQ
jgi:hypothetical protein